jgi:hypothetical protein
MKKNKYELKVQIRYNTNYPKTSDKKWKILINDIQHLVDEIEVDRPCYTSQDVVKGDDGADVIKFHISTQANNVLFETKQDKLIATVI